MTCSEASSISTTSSSPGRRRACGSSPTTSTSRRRCSRRRFTEPNDPLQWCPQLVATGDEGQNREPQRASNTATTLVQAGIQNPMNPNGCRLQTVWREIDLSLSLTDAFDFNLDIEQMYWAPFTASNLLFDEFDRVSLWLGHSEYRPMPCVGDFSSTPSLPDSGLQLDFEENFAWNPAPDGSSSEVESQAPRGAAYIDAPLTIDPSQTVLETNGVNRFLPLPEFQKPYFVFRDETVIEQGGRSDPDHSDIDDQKIWPYLASPFLMGLGRRRVDRTGDPGDQQFVDTFWNDGRSRSLENPDSDDNFTGGLVGNVALPLLADFWTYCDSSELPAGGGYVAFGTNGWQTAITVQSSPRPFFRVYSAGRPATPSGLPPLCRAPGDEEWSRAFGGFTPPPVVDRTDEGDNTFYWIMMDVVKRQTVITNGFVDLYNPHRVPEGFADPRLGPYYLQNGTPVLPQDVLPSFAYEFDPPLDKLAPGTSIVPQFRGASRVDETPFYWDRWVRVVNDLYDADQLGSSARSQLRPDCRELPTRSTQGGRRAHAQVGHTAVAQLVDLSLQPYGHDVCRGSERADGPVVYVAVRRPERVLQPGRHSLRELALHRWQQRRRHPAAVAGDRELRAVVSVPAAVAPFSTRISPTLPNHAWRPSHRCQRVIATRTCPVASASPRSVCAVG